MSDLKSRLIKGITQSILGKYLTYLIQVTIVIIFARLFTPEQFGIVTTLQIFTTLFIILGESGIIPAIISKKVLTLKSKYSIFWFMFFLSTVLSLMCLVFFPLVELTFDFEFDIAKYLVAVTIGTSVLNSVPKAYLLRDERFLSVSKNDIFGELISLPLVLLVYYMGFPLIALISRYSFASVIKLMFNYISWQKFCYRKNYFCCNINDVKSLWGFTKDQMLFNIVIYFSRNFDNLAVGKVLGMKLLGIYDKAYILMSYPLQLLTFALSPAIQPILTKHSDDKKTVLRANNFIVNALSIVGVSAGFFVYINTEIIVVLLLGENWLEVIPILKILSVSIPFQVVFGSAGGIFQAMHRTKMLVRFGFVQSIILILSVMISIQSDKLYILAIGISLAYVVIFFWCYIYMYKYLFETKISIFMQSVSIGMSLFIIYIISFEMLSISVENINGWILLAISSCFIGIVTIIALLYSNKKFTI